MYALFGKEGGGFSKPRALDDEDGDPLRVGQYWDYDAKKWTGAQKSRFSDEL